MTTSKGPHMTCTLTPDDRCAEHGTPLEDMAHCPNDGATCTHDCRHPSCHVVTGRKVPGPLAKLTPVCALCGPVGLATDADGVKEARAGHLQEVAR